MTSSFFTFVKMNSRSTEENGDLFDRKPFYLMYLSSYKQLTLSSLQVEIGRIVVLTFC